MFFDIRSSTQLRSNGPYPSLGRFVEPDPIGYEGGPNLYAYAGNDPVGKRDPSGLCAISFGTSCDSGDAGLDQAVLDFKASNLRLLLDRSLSSYGANIDVRSDACLHVDAGACGPLLPTTENVYWTLVEGVPRKIGEGWGRVKQCAAGMGSVDPKKVALSTMVGAAGPLITNDIKGGLGMATRSATSARILSVLGAARGFVFSVATQACSASQEN